MDWLRRQFGVLPEVSFGEATLDLNALAPRDPEREAFQSEQVARGELSSDNTYQWHLIDPDRMYPEAIRFTRSLVAGDPSAVPQHLRQPLGIARRVPEAGWMLAGTRRAEECDKTERALREAAIEAARLVFTAALRDAVGRPLGVHIARGSGRWRL